MLIVRGVIGGILLFLGHEINFLFAGAMAALLGFRLAPILPIPWPAWADTVFIIGLGIIAAVAVLLNERLGYFISGFLAGGYFMIEYFAPNTATVPLLPFIAGAIIGALILGIFTEWALILVTALIGAYYLVNLFVLPAMLRILISAGLFIIGALTQVIIMQAQRQAER